MTSLSHTVSKWFCRCLSLLIQVPPYPSLPSSVYLEQGLISISSEPRGPPQETGWGCRVNLSCVFPWLPAIRAPLQMFFYLTLPLGSDASSLALSDVAGTPLFQPQGFALASVVALYPMNITVFLNNTLLKVILFPKGQNQ